MEVDSYSRSSRAGRFVPIPACWDRIEVPRGCLVELPPVLTYFGSKLLRDPHSGFWTVFYTEWAVKTAVFILWDVYDNCRLWYLQPTTIDHLKRLDLRVPLGGSDNSSEFRRLLAVIEQTDWSAVPKEWSRRGKLNRRDHSKGRDAEAGDYIFYDPWSGEKVSAARASELRAQRPAMPVGQLTGYTLADEPYEGEALDAQQEAQDAPQNDPEPEVGGDRGDEPDAPMPDAYTASAGGAYARDSVARQEQSYGRASGAAPSTTRGTEYQRGSSPYGSYRDTDRRGGYSDPYGESPYGRQYANERSSATARRTAYRDPYESLPYEEAGGRAPYWDRSERAAIGRDAVYRFLRDIGFRREEIDGLTRTQLVSYVRGTVTFPSSFGTDDEY